MLTLYLAVHRPRNQTTQRPAYFEILSRRWRYRNFNYRSATPDDRSVNDRAFRTHARLMKDGAAGEIIGCRSAQCTHAITVGLLASRVTYSHSRVETPSHRSTTADPGTAHCIIRLYSPIW